MRNILAACLFAAALLAGGAAGAVALPNDPPRAVLLPGGESMPLVRPVSAGRDEEGCPVWADAASAAPVRPRRVF